MVAFTQLLVLIAIFLSASHANAFTSMSPVSGNQVQEKHWFQFEEPMNNPTNEPSCEPTIKPIKRIDLDAELPNILTSKQGKYSLLAKQDAEFPSMITVLITQFTSNTSYMFEVVHGVSHIHVKYIVTG
jgi:hypothetical protein